MTIKDLEPQYASLTPEKGKTFIKSIHSAFSGSEVNTLSLLGFLERILADFKSLPMFLSAFCIFVFFAKTDIGSRGWINALARPAFAVYVAHQTPAFWPHHT